MSEKTGLLTPCGSNCTECPNYLGTKEPKCEGCKPLNGKPFWAKGTCPLYLCASKHEVAHCGQCSEFPCELFIGHYDPNNPEGQRNAVTRTGILAYRRKHGDEKTLALMDRVRPHS